MAGYIRYNNQGATRNLPLSEDLIKRLAYLESMGVTAEVFSGGQPGIDEGGNRTGSVRHDHGNAADIRFHKDGKMLNWANPEDRPIFEEIVRTGKQQGITGFGAGPGYMGEGSMHVGMGEPVVWGAGGKSENAPKWLKDAYFGAPSPAANDPVAEVAAAADPIEMAAAQAKLQGTETTAATTPKPESRNGILVQAFNKITGSDVQVPDTILGADTSKVMKGVSGIGDFAKALTESTDDLNRQTQAAARSAQSRRNDSPVEMSFMETQIPGIKRKRKGALSGLGGYLI